MSGIVRITDGRYFLGSREEGRFRHARVSFHGKKSEAGAEWCLFARGFGFGVELGRNGSESDCGVSFYAGPLGSVWLRLRSPWTKWMNVKQGKPDWAYSRKTGFRFFPWEGCYFQFNFEDIDGCWTKGQPWWRDATITKRTFFGLTKTDTDKGASGLTQVPLPEGNYPARWEHTTYTNHYLSPLGKLRDRVLGPREHSLVSLDIDGGIPVEGKGENSWDCGMDGLFGVSGATVEDAVANAVRSVLRDRERSVGAEDGGLGS